MDLLATAHDEDEKESRRTISYDVSENTSKISSNVKGGAVILLKGLPFSVKDREIEDFLAPEVKLSGSSQIKRIMRRGQFSGDCLVLLNKLEDVELALEKHRKHIGSRYVEVFRSSVSELERETGSDSGRDHGNRGRKISGERGGGGSSRDNRGGGGGSTVSANNFVQLRGLPFMVKESEIKSFLSGCEVLADGILFGPPDMEVMRRGSTCNGDAFVELASEEDVQNALKKHRKNIGPRYIEIFRCSFQEVERYMEKRSGKGDRRRSRSPRDRDSFSRGMQDMPPRRMSPPRMEMAPTRFEQDVQRVRSEFFAPEPEFRQDLAPRMAPSMDYAAGYSSAISEHNARLSELERLERLHAARAMELELEGMRMAQASAMHPQLPTAPAPIQMLRTPPPALPEQTYEVEMEGFPYDCTRHELIEFLAPAKPSYVEFVKDSDGKVQEAFAEFNSLRDLEVALSKHRKVIRSRWIAVRERRVADHAQKAQVGGGASRPERDSGPRRDRSRSPIRRFRGTPPRDEGGRGGGERYLIKLLGLPFDCEDIDIDEFFARVGRPISVNIRKDNEGKSRDAVVEFATYSQMLDAEKLDKQYIKHRYVDIKRL